VVAPHEGLEPFGMLALLVACGARDDEVEQAYFELHAHQADTYDPRSMLRMARRAIANVRAQRVDQ
jgi:hypothetical protein